MPLDAVTLQNELEALFEAPPPTSGACAGLWAAAMLDYAAAVVPASTTVSVAAQTLATALASAFASPTAPADFDLAFAAFAASVGLGMAPAFTGAPPAAPLGIGTLLVGSQPTHAVAAAAFAALIDEWFRTGSATLVAPPFTVVNWS
jgi:hypothetical protein